MYVTIKKEVMADALAKVVPAVAKDTKIPILNTIKMVVTEEAVTLTGSDTQTSIEVTIYAKEHDVIVEKTGSIVLPLLFHDIIKRLDGDITIKTNKLNAMIKSGKAKYDLNGVDAEQYPRAVDEDIKSSFTSFTIKGSELKSLFNKTAYCTSRGDARPILQGLCIDIYEQGIKVTATDSHRLSIASSNVSVNDELRAIVHRDSIVKLSRAIEDHEMVEILLSMKHMIGKTKGLTFRFSLLEGSYPEVSRILNRNPKTTLKLNRAELLSALERLAILAGNNVVNFKSNQFVELTANKQGSGSAKESLFIGECQSDEEISIAFSAAYLIDALKVIETKDVILGFNSELEPFTVTPDKTGTEELHLILPVRIN